MGDEREEIARIIDPEIWADLEAVRGEGGPWGGYSGQARIDTSLSKADAILARAQVPCTPVAQSVELAAHNGLVPGSSPGGSTDARAQGPAPGEADHIPDVGKKIIPAPGEAVAWRWRYPNTNWTYTDERQRWFDDKSDRRLIVEPLYAATPREA